MSENGMLTCEDLVELITEYLEGALSVDEHARFEMHLADCDGCQNYVDQMRKTLRAVNTLTPEHLEPEACDLLLDIFRTWQRENQ